MYRKLLLPLSDTPCGAAALAAGWLLARQWRAHLAGLIVQIDSWDVAPLAGEGLSGAMIEDMMQAAERDGAERARRLRDAFFAAAGAAAGTAAGTAAGAAAGVDAGAATGAAGQADGSLATVRGRCEDLVPSLARLADLTILPHPDRAQDEAAADTLHAVLFDSGRPVLIAPRTAPATLGQRCCIAWNGTVESSAALAAMLPFLARAQAVRVLHAGAYQRRGPPAADVMPYLALHGVSADAVEFAPVNRDVGAGLLQAAADFGADLLGMGAYSHSRLRQLILGGVTRHVLENSRLAVLMSR
jgi:nucleotide-binding universal stress UspA family protein